MELPNIYRGDYRLLAIVPLLIIVFSLFYIPQIKLGVDFQGGTLLTLALPEPVNADALQAQLAGDGLHAKVTAYNTALGPRAEIEIPQSDDLVMAEKLKENFNSLLPVVSRLEVNAYSNTSVQSDYQLKKAELDAVADKMFSLAKLNRASLNITGTNDLQRAFGSAYSKTYGDYTATISQSINKYAKYKSISVQTVSPVLSSHFIEQARNVVIFSALLSMILVFFFFRNVVPSIAVLSGALADVLIAMGAMGLFGIPFTLNSFAALLMLIGFSLDTDILLTTRMLKRKGDPREHAYDAMKTGMTMSVMAMVAFAALFILALLTRIPTYYEISAVALAGLVGDIFATWGINAVMILFFVEKKEADKRKIESTGAH